MGTYAGIDLHSSNNYIGIMDQDHKRLFGKRLPNRLDKILMVLEPFKSELEGVVVESTYNWYWLVDGLREHGHRVHLANPSAIKQYEGGALPVSPRKFMKLAENVDNNSI